MSGDKLGVISAIHSICIISEVKIASEKDLTLNLQTQISHLFLEFQTFFFTKISRQLIYEN